MNISGSDKIVRIIAGGVELAVAVVPRSSRCEFSGVHNNALRIKLTSPPVENEANLQCCTMIAQKLGIARGRVSIIRGNTTRKKILKIEGVSEREVREKLLQGEL